VAHVLKNDVLSSADETLTYRDASQVVVPKWMQDMYECWNSESTDEEACANSMKGDRSSHNSSMPAVIDTVEAFISIGG